MIYGHLNHNHAFLPSPEQILSGIILAQVDQFRDEDLENFTPIIKSKVEVWKTIFSLGEMADLKKPLSPKILGDPNHKFVKTLLYIYSMESFVFSAMNKASRQKDVSKIEFYGPLASALGFIVHCSNQKQIGFKEEFLVYRGLKLSPEELKEKYKIGNTIHLSGFTSSTLERETAVKFAIDDPTVDNPEKVPLLIKIDFKGTNQFFFLNTKELSAYPGEQEVLLQDGIEYKVTKLEVVDETVSQGKKEYVKKLNVVTLVNVPDKYARHNCCLKNFKLLVN